jgi:hypothetical protein
MIPTAEELLRNKYKLTGDRGELRINQIVLFMTEFAKLHVEGAKEQFKIVFSEIDDPYPFEYNDPLEDVYPLTNIK